MQTPKCDSCGTSKKNLFFHNSFFCPNDCDRRNSGAGVDTWQKLASTADYVMYLTSKPNTYFPPGSPLNNVRTYKREWVKSLPADVPQQDSYYYIPVTVGGRMSGGVIDGVPVYVFERATVLGPPVPASSL